MGYLIARSSLADALYVLATVLLISGIALSVGFHRMRGFDAPSSDRPVTLLLGAAAAALIIATLVKLSELL